MESLLVKAHACRMAGSVTSSLLAGALFDLTDIPVVPHQPTTLEFPKKAFGKTKVVYYAFQPTWFKQWPFLHYDESKDAVYCHTCVTGFKEKKMRSPHADSSFVSALFNFRKYYIVEACIISLRHARVYHTAHTD